MLKNIKNNLNIIYQVAAYQIYFRSKKNNKNGVLRYDEYMVKALLKVCDMINEVEQSLERNFWSNNNNQNDHQYQHQIGIERFQLLDNKETPIC